MERRDFIRTSLVAGTAALGGTLSAESDAATRQAQHTFKLKYAPHDGMFENSAGDDILDQLRFMADVGFRAFEDNGMMGRPPAQQEQIGNELARLGMTMGVFVISAYGNSEVWATTGKKELVDHFVDTCRTAVDVAKRVNAKWMTVVPG
ncbi:MAG TPA: hypothetical protein VFG50_05790, partial [Rhodothermales bacterium]|nr:hypothetical protein [Rhodothermales bacterium]